MKLKHEINARAESNVDTFDITGSRGASGGA